MVDEACVRRLDAREFRSMGMPEVALALLCQSPANKKAVEAAGHECPGSPRAAAPAAAPAVSLIAPEVIRTAPVEVKPESVAQTSPVSLPVSNTSAPEAQPSSPMDVPSQQIQNQSPIDQTHLSMETVTQNSENK